MDCEAVVFNHVEYTHRSGLFIKNMKSVSQSDEYFVALHAETDN